MQGYTCEGETCGDILLGNVTCTCGTVLNCPAMASKHYCNQCHSRSWWAFSCGDSAAQLTTIDRYIVCHIQWFKLCRLFQECNLQGAHMRLHVCVSSSFIWRHEKSNVKELGKSRDRICESLQNALLENNHHKNHCTAGFLYKYHMCLDDHVICLTCHPTNRCDVHIIFPHQSLHAHYIPTCKLYPHKKHTRHSINQK